MNRFEFDFNYGFKYACKYGHLDIVKYLLSSTELTKHSYIHDNNDSGFELACIAGHLEIVKYLLTSDEIQIHADINYQNCRGFRAACSHGHLGIVKYLIEQGAYVHAQDDQGLIQSIINNRDDITTYLITNELVTRNDQIDLVIKDKPEIKHLFNQIELYTQLNTELDLKNTKI